MKYFLFSLLLSLFCLKPFASVKAVLDFATFFSPQSGPYVEIYLSIDGNSIVYDSLDQNEFQASLQVGYLIKKKGSDETVNYNKFEIKSPIYTADDKVEYLLDLKRMSVPNGNYDLEIFLKDLNSKDSITVVKAPLEMNFSNEKAQFSQIQLTPQIEKATENNDFSKHGIEIIPHPTAYFPVGLDQLAFYVELYNTDKALGEDEMFLLEFKVVSLEDGQVANNLRSFMRTKSDELIPIIKAISIEELASGNYQLLVEARNRDNELIASSTKFFQRNNPAFTKEFTADIGNSFVGKYKDAEVLSEHIESLFPIATESEKNFAEFRLENPEILELQKFLFNFWYKRNPSDPEAAWEEYRQEVMVVNESFGSYIRKGFETDPGFIYLKYGKPNTITKSRYEPGAYPYEVWQYNQVKQRTNAKFIFYNNSGEMGEYELLHSNVPGEIANYRWKAVIYGRTESFPGTDKVEPSESFGKDADDFYNNPR